MNIRIIMLRISTHTKSTFSVIPFRLENANHQSAVIESDQGLPGARGLGRARQRDYKGT